MNKSTAENTQNRPEETNETFSLNIGLSASIVLLLTIVKDCFAFFGNIKSPFIDGLFGFLSLVLFL